MITGNPPSQIAAELKQLFPRIADSFPQRSRLCYFVGPFSALSPSFRGEVRAVRCSASSGLEPHDTARVKLLAEFGLVAAALIWGFNFILVKLAVGHMPPVYYVGLRFLVGAVFLLPFSWKQMRRLDRQGWLIGIGVGVLLFGGFALQTIGLALHVSRASRDSSPAST